MKAASPVFAAQVSGIPPYMVSLVMVTYCMNCMVHEYSCLLHRASLGSASAV